MNPAAVALLPLGAAVNLRLVPAMALRSPNGPHFLFQSPHNLGDYITDTHEVGPSVPVNRAMAGAALHSIPLARCLAPLPPFLLEIIDRAHGFLVGSRSRKTEPNKECVSEVRQAFHEDGKSVHG